MKLATRLWLLGAVVPMAGVLLALWLAGAFFEAWLSREVDRALLSQAAVESVSLFDGPGGQPHLHLLDSPLEEEVRPFAPVAELFGPEGRRLVSYPSSAEGVHGPTPAPLSAGEPPRFETLQGADGARLRQLTVGVKAPSGGVYTLRLSASLAQQDSAVRAFQSVTLAVAVLLGVVLFALQTWQARWLAGRLNQLRARIGRLREGVLPAAPGTRRGDEVSEVEGALHEASERLNEAREAQEQLIARAAHELRTPLALMRTSLDLALWKERDAQSLREALEETRREVARLSALAGNLLDLASFGKGGWDVRAGDLREVVEDAAAAARAEAEGRGVWVTVDGPEPAPCAFHGASVRQAVDNLLANALRYAPKGTEISVRLAHEGNGWRLSVRDRGPGIPVEHRQSVFQPFHRVEPKGEGTGLGLAVVQEVAKRHGGRAWVAEVEGSGAEVVLELPESGPGPATAVA
ncbi:HAMP domain-containing sensor histidine kinase [Vitiosangium sp. GDMCC 1.1324]|uniref:sensor histidine kinase n=1 Tax=Vitiosangium sp. (strain GDMCC 1.1324) TaxID=2138576 RepID=UPI000D3D9F37|nr:HAMP domain-containing sensor histidine kinase [Vitiosangium sp. GDMCC 1.1324]PTL83102.1 sensor histidine kinase [Vitiosangium sp. GDMCC 1.1324]